MDYGVWTFVREETRKRAFAVRKIPNNAAEHTHTAGPKVPPKYSVFFHETCEFDPHPGIFTPSRAQGAESVLWPRSKSAHLNQVAPPRRDCDLGPERRFDAETGPTSTVKFSVFRPPRGSEKWKITSISGSHSFIAPTQILMGAHTTNYRVWVQVRTLLGFRDFQGAWRTPSFRSVKPPPLDLWNNSYAQGFVLRGRPGAPQTWPSSCVESFRLDSVPVAPEVLGPLNTSRAALPCPGRGQGQPPIVSNSSSSSRDV